MSQTKSFCHLSYFAKQKKKIGCIDKSNKMKKTSETDNSDSSDDDFFSKSAVHMLRIKPLKSVSWVEEESVTDASFLEKEVL